MDVAAFLLVVTLINCIGYSRQLQAKKCHRATLFGIISCTNDLRKAHCEQGLIFVDEVKYEDVNCFWCISCCESIEAYASEDIRWIVTEECNHKRSCSLASIDSGNIIVEYTCKETSTLSLSSSTIVTSSVVSTATNVSKSITSTTSPLTSMTTKANSSTSITDETSTLTPIHSTDTTTGLDTTESSDGDSGISSPSHNSTVARQSENTIDNDSNTGVIVAVVLAVVACLASIPVTIILCRRYKNRKQERHPGGVELDAFHNSAYSQSTPTRDEHRGPSKSSTDTACSGHSRQVPVAGNVNFTTTEAAGTSNEYDHIDHRKANLTGNTMFEGVSANNCDNVYDTTIHTGTNANVWNSESNNVYDTAGDKSGNTENIYDTTHNADNKTVAENCNAYDVKQPRGKTSTTDNVYDTTQHTGEKLARYEEDVYDTAKA